MINLKRPRIIVWRPINTEKTLYNIIDNYRLRVIHINAMESYYFANVSFIGNDTIEFQSGDVIGYRHRSSPCYTVWSIRTEGYTSYSASSSTILRSGNTVDIEGNSVTATTDMQPLIQVTFGKYLHNERVY